MTVETPETQASPEAPPERACSNCGAPIAPGQGWCLECGNATPGRFGGRPGWRAATTIVTTVLLLVGGAVAASYAALNDHAKTAAATPAPPSAAPQVAQAPPVTTPTAPAPAPATSTPAPPPTTSTPTPPPAPKPATPAPAPNVSTTPTVPAKTPTPKPKPKVEPGLQPLTLGPEAATVYDPYKRATDQTDPFDSYDGDPKTSFSITTNPGAQMGVGLDFDLKTAHDVRAIFVKTTTPGFRVEVYGAARKLPPDILDTRWQHVASADNVAADPKKNGLEKIKFDQGKYRHILLWFTTPPPAGPTVTIVETKILD